jgi:hypothetical protein
MRTWLLPASEAISSMELWCAMNNWPTGLHCGDCSSCKAEDGGCRSAGKLPDKANAWCWTTQVLAVCTALLLCIAGVADDYSEATARHLRSWCSATTHSQDYVMHLDPASCPCNTP